MEIVKVACIKCQKEKPETEFHKGTGKHRNGRKSTCKACQKEYMKSYYAKHGDAIRKQANEHYKNNREQHLATTKEWVKKNPRRVKHNLLNWSFGISLEHYEQLLESQNGVCAICKKGEQSNRNKTLCVDHCHDTGEIRGLLCSHCNRGIGLLGDNPETLESAITYLNNHLTPVGE
jgi:hypothetical protein